MKIKELQKLNLEINNKIEYKEEIFDYWSPLQETLKRGFGDCDDIAIAKFFEIKYKYPQLEPILVYCHYLGTPHMVLWAENYILDNIWDTLSYAHDRTDINPIYGFDEEYLYLIDENWNFDVVGNSSRVKKWKSCLQKENKLHNEKL